jgi:hypothetical protein
LGLIDFTGALEKSQWPILTINGRANCIEYQNQAAAAAPPFGNLLKGSKIGGLHHYCPFMKEI